MWAKLPRLASADELCFARNDNNAAAVHDLGLASANLTLEATARGLFVHQMIGILPDKARELYRIPEGVQPLTGLAIGYAADPNTLPEKYRERDLAPRSRKPASSLSSAAIWERPQTSPSRTPIKAHKSRGPASTFRAFVFRFDFLEQAIQVEPPSEHSQLTFGWPPSRIPVLPKLRHHDHRNRFCGREFRGDRQAASRGRSAVAPGPRPCRFRRFHAGDRGHSLPSPGPPASLSLFRGIAPCSKQAPGGRGRLGLNTALAVTFFCSKT